MGEVLAGMALSRVRWFLDRPVSNSGRLRQLMEEMASAAGWPWDIELVDNPDRAMVESGAVVASSDSWVLDHAAGWVGVPELVIEQARAAAWIVDLGPLA